jgi:hypothetical protein
MRYVQYCGDYSFCVKNTDSPTEFWHCHWFPYNTADDMELRFEKAWEAMI